MENYKSLKHITEEILQGKITLRGLVFHYLGNIKSRPELNAFIEVYEEEALQKAEEVEHKLKNGKAGKLAGMVVGLKDNICYKGHIVSASSKYPSSSTNGMVITGLNCLYVVLQLLQTVIS